LLCCYATFLSQDLERLQQILSRINLSPLGCGALAGNPFNVDREFLAQELEFEGIIENSLVAVSDRDFVTEFLFWTSLTSQHLSRLAEDLIIYGTAEFNFVQLADAYSTGSSLMPQKKNSDSLELLRGKAGRLFGHLAGFMMSVKGLPSTYNKDLQESQEPMFDAMSQINSCLQITTGVISTMTIRPEAMRKALGAEMLATDLADYLVRKGVPFRETHHISGQAVALAERKGCGIDKLSVEEFKGLSTVFEEDVKHVFNFEASVEARKARGGTAKQSVLDQIERLRKFVSK
jgi:argininosuccinate lyase